MSTLPDPSFSGNALEPVCLSVTQLTQAIKGALEPSFSAAFDRALRSEG